VSAAFSFSSRFAAMGESCIFGDEVAEEGGNFPECPLLLRENFGQKI
jgi:hypothetical protein